MTKRLLTTSAILLSFVVSQPVWSMNDQTGTHVAQVKRKITKGKVKTSAGELFYRDSGGTGPAVLCINSNSTDGRLFKNLMRENPDLRFVALDSPGGGKSFKTDSELTEEVCSFPGCARVILEGFDEVLRESKTEREGSDVKEKFFLVGISKGGHEALHVSAQAPDRVIGMVLSGTTPFPHFTSQEHASEVLGAAFKASPAGALTGKKENFTVEEARLYLEANGLDPSDPKMLKTAMETNGLSRALMFKTALANQRVDDIETLKMNTHIPVLILGGDQDMLINYDYVRGLGLPSHVEIEIVEGGNHTFVWNNPKLFNAHMTAFFSRIKLKSSL